MKKNQNNSEESTAKIHELEQTIQAQSKEISQLREKLERMNELLLNAQRARFGQSSEKKAYVSGELPEQMALFNEAELSQDEKAPEPTEETFTVRAYTKKKKRTVDELTAGLPHEEIVLELDENEQLCGCGHRMRLIGKKFVRREMIIIPRSEKILDYYICTYACDSCEKDTGYAHLTSTVAPPPLMKHSLASPSTVADVMTRKYVDGLPLARQEKIWKREGVALSRATLANWVIIPAQTWLKPLYRRLKQHLLENPVIYADETVVQVLKEDGKPATSQSRMWVYASDERCSKPVRFFEYQSDRSGKHAELFLKGFNGHLVTDGYAGYNKVEGVTRCGCWAHMRRKWREAMPNGTTTKTSKAAMGFEYCNKLFALERKWKDLTDKQRLEARQAKAIPLIDEYWLCMKTLDPGSGSKLAEAVTYAKNQKEHLCEFLNCGAVEISNNFAENAIRPFVIGRKNWLFCDTVNGANSSAIVYTLVETAKANGLDPYRYLLRILSLLPYLGKEPSDDKLDELLPWSPDMQVAALES